MPRRKKKIDVIPEDAGDETRIGSTDKQKETETAQDGDGLESFSPVGANDEPPADGDEDGANAHNHNRKKKKSKGAEALDNLPPPEKLPGRFAVLTQQEAGNVNALLARFKFMIKTKTEWSPAIAVAWDQDFTNSRAWILCNKDVDTFVLHYPLGDTVRPVFKRHFKENEQMAWAAQSAGQYSVECEARFAVDTEATSKKNQRKRGRRKKCSKVSNARDVIPPVGTRSKKRRLIPVDSGDADSVCFLFFISILVHSFL